MARKKAKEDYGKSLLASYEQWRQLYEYGGHDPNWPDGTNLNLVRNHITFYKHRLEEDLTLEGYPEAYHWGTPPLVPRGYMARPDEIRAAARVSLARYQADPDYLFLCSRVDSLDPKQAKKLCVYNVIHYAVGLERAIKEDDLVTMRRHGNAEQYLPSFASCAKQVRELGPPENEQLDLHWRSENSEDEPEEDEDIYEDEEALEL